MLPNFMIEILRYRHVSSEVSLPIGGPGAIIDRCFILDLGRSLSSEEILGSAEKGHVEEEEVGEYEEGETEEGYVPVGPRP